MKNFDLDEFMIEHNDAVRFVDVEASQTNVYAIGDVHGCYDEMLNLIEECFTHSLAANKRCRIYLIGDLIDRGPAFVDIFILLNQISYAECIIGNHELNFYLEQMGKECRSKARRVNHDIFNELGEDDQAMIMKTIGDMPNAVYLNFYDDTGREYMPVMLTHSPVRNVEYMSAGVFSNMNAPQCCMRPTPVNMDRLERNYEGIIMVHGHQSWNFKPVHEQMKDQAQYSNRVINIDSGCVYGDKLTALCINTLEVLEVNAIKAYSERH